MTSKQKKKILLSGFCVGLPVLVVVLLLSVLDLNSFKPRIEEAASNATGMDFRINGRIGLALFPRIGISLGGVRAGNGGSEVLTAENILVGLELWPLIHRQIGISELMITRPHIAIERDRTGRFNFEKKTIKAPKETKSMPPPVSIARIGISGGEVSYLDRKSGFRAEVHGIDLKVTGLSFGPGKGENVLSALSFSGSGGCKEIKSGDFRIEKLNFEIKGDRGIIDVSPFTAEFFGAGGEGSIHADLTAINPAFRFRFKAPHFSVEKFLKSVAGKKTMTGKMDLSMDIATEGKSFDIMKRKIQGNVALKGENLLVEGVDLDGVLSKIEASESITLADTGAFLFSGPIGVLLTKAYDISGVYMETRGGQTPVKQLNSEWKIKNGVAAALDVAFSTKKNRIALKGGLDLVNERYDGIIVSALDRKGCARFTQKIHGPFRDPQIDKMSALASIAGPALRLFDDARYFAESGTCTPFYKGVVKHP